MGVDTRRPMLPAPTESITGGSATGTDLATDVSRRTDKTSYSIPDDGSPITISTRRKSHNRDKDESNKLTRSSHQSQTSLLIEYFEGGKGTTNLHSRPSVRVRVTPSAARKLRDQTDHIQITESGGSRKPVYTRRISLGNPSKQKQLPEAAIDDQSISSYNSAADEGHTAPRRLPLEIEFVDRDQTSEASNISRDARYMQPTSDISSMPADSLLDGPPAQTPRRKRSQSLNREGAREPDDLLKAPSRRRSRSLSRERIAHKVAEKLNNQPREASSHHSKRSQRSMSRADSKEFLEADSKSPRRKLQKSREDDIPASPESSLLSASAVSSRRKSGDQYSFRSGTSRSSINNPKLLETVEDAIRRLILPELKELKKDQKVTSNTSKFEREMSASMGASRGSGSSASRDELGRRLSKHASAPDVKNPTVILHKDSKDEGIILSDDRSTEHEEQEKGNDVTSPSDKIYIKGARPDLREEEKIRRQRSKGLRDAEAAGIVGTALTTAALKHHDSQSSMDRRERRKRRSRGHSREPSFNETELVFQKHNVAPMPMRSEIDSELTRESILSQRTEGTATPRQGVEVRNVSHSSPRGTGSAGSSTPTRRTPRGGRRLGTYHSNMSNGDLSIHSASERDLHKTSHSSLADSDSGTAGAIAAAAAANLLDDHHPHETEPDYSDQRALSPIQSVASDNNDTERGGEWHFETAEHGEPRLSIDSLSSAPSTSLARSKRLAEANFEKGDETQDRYDEAGVELGYEEESPREPTDGRWEEPSETDDDEYHRSTARPSADDIRIDEKRMTNYTDDSFDTSYVDKATEGRQVSDGAASKPEYVHPPVAVESAVASLLDPSVLSGTRSGVESPNRRWTESPKIGGDTDRDLYGSDRGSPLKQRQDAATPDETSFPKRMGVTSPPQSVAQSFEDEDEVEQPRGDTTGVTDAESPMHEAENIPDSESEINTNPSIIQGPISGVPHDNRDHWPYNPTPPKSQGDHYSADRDFDNNMAEVGMGFADQTGYDTYYQSPYGNSYGQDYMAGNMYSTPPGAKDEGYISAANPRSPSIATPEQKDKEYASLFDNSPDDMFTPGHQRQISGYSHGIPSPLYDSATGRGIEAIQSKDIVALMDHLTVRDAQRNARDTEILVTLVRSAAEMRTSFEEMKRFIAAQDGIIMESNEKQHERTHRIIGGPRPLPPSGSRSRQLAVEDGEDLRSKRRNVFKRALKGLSLKSSNDLTKIEDMLMQLLDEVEALRAAQEGRNSGAVPQPASVGSTEHGPSSYQDGYEPEGQAGTSSTGDQSGYLSNSSRPIPESHGASGRRGSENRVSTVPEVDEEFDIGSKHDRESSGRRFSSDDRYSIREERGNSAPLSSPPQMPVASGALSNETSPKTNEKSKKHKSSSSSFFPKISRWSKTTASSMGDNIRNTIQPGRKERPFSDASRSGSDLVNGPYNTADYYDPNGDDRIRSTYTLDEGRRQENRPPSPLIPSQVSENPKYQAHRDSLDLQHPQPRQGPTGRFQSQLESEAQNFTPISPNSEAWGSNPSLLHPGQTQNRFSYGSRLSPISDAGYSEQGSLSEKQNAPPRPPKIKDDGPLVPQRPPKVKEDEQQPSYADRVVSRQGSSMRSTPPQRKPTGPRPITGSGQYSPGNARRHRYRGSPDQVDDDY